MKVLNVILALIAVAAAAPAEAQGAAANAPAVAKDFPDADDAPEGLGDADPDVLFHRHCKPGTYSCTHDHHGWRVCDISGHWVFAGSCGPHERCVFNELNGSPYCFPFHHHHHHHHDGDEDEDED